MCMAPLSNSTIEHLHTLAMQAEAEGFTTCWLDLGHETGIAEAVKKYSGRNSVPVRHERDLDKHLKANRPVAIWLHTPYPEHYPPFFWSSVETWPLAYAPYSSGFPSGSWEHGEFGLDTFKKCTWLLATHEGMREGYLRHGIAAERILLTGGPIMYEIQNSPSSPEDRNDLLWAPHWIEDYFGQGCFTTWRWVAPLLLSHAKAHPEISIVVRPHPFLAAMIEKASPDDADANNYRHLLALPNVRQSQRSLIDDVLASDALLSEGMSLNVYFATTGKPLGMTRGTVSEITEEWQFMLDISDELTTAESTTEWLEALPHAQPTPARQNAIAEVLPTFGQSPLAIWSQHTKELAAQRADSLVAGKPSRYPAFLKRKRAKN